MAKGNLKLPKKFNCFFIQYLYIKVYTLSLFFFVLHAHILKKFSGYYFAASFASYFQFIWKDINIFKLKCIHILIEKGGREKLSY